MLGNSFWIVYRVGRVNDRRDVFLVTAIAIANARLREELGEQARRDSLTQLPNPGTFIRDLCAAG